MPRKKELPPTAGKRILGLMNLDPIFYIYIVAFLVFFTGVILSAWFGWQYYQSKHRSSTSVIATSTLVIDEMSPQSKKICTFRRKLDGVCVDDMEYLEGVNQDEYAVGVMVENSADAWPLSGLSFASVVYEAPAEGNIPRFLAIYPINSIVDKVGPVRSARPYFVDWISEYGVAAYMHVGGSPQALEKLQGYTDIADVNEMGNGWYFWRSTDRGAPHNVYTNGALWQKVDYRTTAKKASYWAFNDLEMCQIDCVTEITAAFSTNGYTATWKFVTSTGEFDRGMYQRYQNGKQQFDYEGPAILADTVIIQKVKVAVIDEIGRKKIDTIGSGEAIVYRDGYKIEGTWKKESRTARTRWLDADGNDIPLRGGKIWVEVVQTGK